MFVTIDFQLLSTWFMGLLPYIAVFLLVMLVDFAGGMLLAWYEGRFDLEKAPKFFQTGLLFFWAWLTAELMSILVPMFHIELPAWGDLIADYGPNAVYAIIVVTKYGAGIVKNGKKILELLKNPE